MKMRILLFNIIGILLITLIIDLTMFWFLADKYAFKLEEYRRVPPPAIGGNNFYPRNYFAVHQQRGFDIGINRVGRHWVDGFGYPIWSNTIGCFDREHTEYDRYIYFAGDSYTWGYTDFDNKFGTIIENLTGTPILKCGVTHTGQRHQYEKYLEIVEQIGHLPTTIFVFYSWNDVANDYAYPHSTVISGWVVDKVFLDKNYELVERTNADLKQRIDDKIENDKKYKEDWETKLKYKIKKYSITVNIILYIGDLIAETSDEFLPAGFVNSTKWKNRSLKPINTLPFKKEGRFWYLQNPYALNNNLSLIDFATYSNSNGIRFVVVLIPPKEMAFNTLWFAEVREFLDSKFIEYFDLTSKFRELEIEPSDLFWENDGHFNISGNKIVAEIITNEFPQVFQYQD